MVRFRLAVFAVITLVAVSGCKTRQTVTVIGPSPTLCGGTCPTPSPPAPPPPPAPSCTYTVSPDHFNFSDEGGQGSTTVTTQGGCPWSSVSHVPWTSIISGNGNGSGTATFNVAENNNPASRTGTMTVAGRTVTVTQGGEPFVASPPPTPSPSPSPTPPPPAPAPAPAPTPSPPPPPPPPPTVISVDVQPETFACVVGGQATLGAFVQVTGGASNAVTWSVSNTSVVQIQSTSQNQVILTCRDVGTVTVTARAVVDPSKSDFATGTVTSGNITCTWSGQTTINQGQSVAATASCINQAGQQFLPAWFSSDPSRVEIRGSQVTVINGQNYQTGNMATIRGIFKGQAIVSVQAAIDRTSPSFSRTVTVQ